MCIKFMQDKEREKIEIKADSMPIKQSAVDLIIDTSTNQQKIYLTESNALILCQKLIDFLFPKYFGKKEK